MAFLFRFGGRGKGKDPRFQSGDLSEIDANSETGYVADEGFYGNAVNDVYFMNPGFGSTSPSPSVRTMRRQYTKTISSRVREYKKHPSGNYSECDVDVALAPSAFSLHNIPNGLRGGSFCSRDDSEIATKTVLNTSGESGRSSSCMRDPHANPMFLIDMYSHDDCDVGSCTMEKIPLRHLGSALSYRLSVSGTPDFSVYGDDDMTTCERPGHARRYSDISDTLPGVKERNKMVCLESIVGGMQRSDNSVFEFGVINSDCFGIPQLQPTPRLFRSASDQPHSPAQLPEDFTLKKPVPEHQQSSAVGTQLSSYPLFLTNILEEDEDDEESDVEIVVEDAQGKTQNDDDDNDDAQTAPTFVSHSIEEESPEVIHSKYQVRLAPSEVKMDEGFTNPAFGMDLGSPFSEPPEEQEKRSPLRVESMKKERNRKKDRKTKKRDSDDSRPKPHSEKRDESLHIALLERYLVQSVVNKYFVE